MNYADALRLRRFAVPWVADYLPTVLPPSWEPMELAADGVKFGSPLRGAVVIVTGEVRQGKRWLHLSMSFAARLPRWPELVEAKELFLGVDTYAAQVCPPRTHYVNIHPNVAHLFACVDGWPLPEFSSVTPGGRRTL